MAPESASPVPLPLQEFLGASLATTNTGNDRSVLVVDDNAFARGIACAAAGEERLSGVRRGRRRNCNHAARTASACPSSCSISISPTSMASRSSAVARGAGRRGNPDSRLLRLDVEDANAPRALRAGFTDYVFKTAEPVRPGGNGRLVSLATSSRRRKARARSSRPPGRRRSGAGQVDGAPVARVRLRGGARVQQRGGLGIGAAARPDAIAADLLMPGMNGMDLCLAVRRDSQLAQIPVVITSSSFSIIDDVDHRLAAEIAPTVLSNGRRRVPSWSPSWPK